MKNVCYWLFLLLGCGWPLWASADEDLPVKVELSGVDAEQQGNIRGFLAIAQQGDAALSPARVKLLHRHAEQEIIDALRPLGYYRPGIHSEIEREARQWRVHYRITPGPPLPIGQADLRLTGAAEQDEVMVKAWRALQLNAGATLRHDHYEAAKKRMQRLAAERGYFTAAFSRHEVKVDLDRYQADIWLWFDSGPATLLGPVNFSGSTLSPELLRRYLRQEQGTPYRQSELLRLQERLLDSGYFSQVEVVSQPDQAQQDEIPIEVTLFDRKPAKYQLGAGYGTDTGARLRGGYEYQPINPAGHRFSSEAVLSQLDQRVGARYRIPLARPDRDQFVTHADWQSEQPDNESESDLFKFGVGVERGLGLWRRLVGIDYQSERFKIGNDKGVSQLLMPTLSLTRIHADQPVHIERGSSVQWSLRGSVEGPISDASFLQSDLKGKLIEPLGRGRLLTRLELGTSWVSDFEKLPPSVRFFAGGDQSVRGYGYKELGPKDSSGKVVGGEQLLVGSAEYEHPFNDNWRGALFVDAGNAFDSFGESLRRSAGFGVRWRLPMGWIRVDLAHALPTESGGWRLHFTLGPDL